MASAMAGIEALKGTHQELKTRMEKSVDDFRAHLAATRTGRANVHMLDQVKVDYYGTDTPVAQLGQVSTPERTMKVPRTNSKKYRIELRILLTLSTLPFYNKT